MATVIDFSAGFPSGKAIKAAGHIGVVSYISPPRESWMKAKPLTKAKVDEYRAAGLRIATVWQYGGADNPDAMRGAAGGRDDAQAAKKKLDEIGMPDAPVFFAVDFDISLQQWNGTAVNYFRAAVEVLGRDRVGIYGHSKVVHWAMEDGVVAVVEPGRVLGWVTKSWSEGVTGSDYAVLYQREHNVAGPDGIQIDVNDAYHRDWSSTPGDSGAPSAPAVAGDFKQGVMRSWSKCEAWVTKLMNKHTTPGRGGKQIKYIVRHHNAGILSIDQIWDVWQQRQASAHYQVDRFGMVGQLVWDSDTAWHAADTVRNQESIGIEHANSGGANLDWPISDATIEEGAHLAAALCLKHGLGRPVFGRNIRDHLETGATSCPFHLADGGKYHRKWMERAQYWYDAMRSATTETPKETPVTDYSRLLLDQIAGPGRTPDGAPSFAGWDIDSIIAAGKKKLRETGGCTVPEMIAIVGEDKLRAIIAEGTQP
ncbi:glycoside hydrolase domain-containing protein [Corynebacterium sp. AOP12-C2-36]|uniref:glycoside hydrolase domain-containing protein n=1 Tax=Corynebacterium sp. AOP12-C2-36 TaxID=3457723 RepID=UPI0040343936